MGKLTQLEEVRRERKRKRLVKRITGLAVGLALLVGVAFFWQQIADLDLATQVEDLIASFGSGSGYPVETPGGIVKTMFDADGQVGVLNDTNLYVYNKSGKQVKNILHGYNNPALRAEGGRILVFDRGGNGLRVESKSKNLFSITYDNPITSADLSSGGNLAVAVGSSQYQGQVIVYNKRFEEIFRWLSSDTVLDVALSDKGNTMAVASVTTVNGQIASTVRLFKFNSEQPVAEIPLTGELVVTLRTGDGGLFYAVTDQGITAITSGGKVEASYSFGGDPLAAFDCSGGKGIDVVLGDFKENRSLTAYVLDEKLKVKGSAVLNVRPELLRHDSKGVYFLADNKVYCYTNTMDLVDTVDTPDARCAYIQGNRLYYTTSKKMDRVSVSRPEKLPKESSPSSAG